MNDNNDKVNREIEKIFSQAFMNKFYDNVDETSQFIILRKIKGKGGRKR